MTGSLDRRQFLGAAVAGLVAPRSRCMPRVGPNDKIVVGIMGAAVAVAITRRPIRRMPGRRGRLHLRRGREPRGQPGARPEGAGQEGRRGRPRLPTHARRQVGRRHHRGDVQPLARAGRDPGVLGGQARLRREAVQRTRPRRGNGSSRRPARTTASCRWATSGGAGRKSSRPSPRSARGRSAAPTSRAACTATPGRRSASAKLVEVPEEARLGPVARPRAAATLSRQHPPLQLALVLALGQRRARQQRRPHHRRGAAGAWASSSRRSVTSSGGRYRYEDDQETPDTHVASFEFEGRKSITWEGVSCNEFRPGGNGAEVVFYGDDGSLAITDGGYAIHDPRASSRRPSRAKAATPSTSATSSPRSEARPAQQRDRRRAPQHPALPPRQHRPPHRPLAQAATRRTARSWATPTR